MMTRSTNTKCRIGHGAITAASAEWSASGKKRDYLYRGALLAEAEEFSKRDAGQLSELEAGFIRAGCRYRTRRRVRLTILASLLIALVAGFVLRLQKESLKVRDVRRIAAANRVFGDWTKMAVLLRECEDPYNAHGWAEMAASAAQHDMAQAELQGRIPMHEVTVAAFGPDSRKVATGHADGLVRIWALDDLSDPMVLTGHKGMIESIAFSPDGGKVATASRDGTARMWGADGLGEPVVLTGDFRDWGRTAAYFSPSGHKVITGTWRGSKVAIWNADGSGPLVDDVSNCVKTVKFSSGGRFVVIENCDLSHDGGGLQVWDIEKMEQHIRVSSLYGCSSCLSADGRSLLVHRTSPEDPSEAGHLAVYNLQSGCRQAYFALEGGMGPDSMALSADGTIVAYSHGRYISLMFLHSTGSKSLSHGNVNEEKMVLFTAFDHSGSLLVTVASDGTAEVHRLATKESIVLHSYGGGIKQAMFSPDDGQILTIAGDGRARLWSTHFRIDSLVDQFKEAPLGLLQSGPDHTIDVSRPDTPESIVHLRADQALGPAKFSPDYKRVLALSKDELSVWVWKSDGSGMPEVLRGHNGPIKSAVFSPDGKKVVTASTDKTARVWHTDGSRGPVVLTGHAHSVNYASFSPDGTRIVTASSDQSARLWNVDGSGEAVALRGGERPVIMAQFSPDGTKVLTTTEYPSTLSVWTLPESGKPMILYVAGGSAGALRSAAFSPDGLMVAAVYEQAKMQIWRVDGTGRPIVAGLSRNMAFPPGDEWVVVGDDERILWCRIDAAVQRLLSYLWRATPICLSSWHRVGLVGGTYRQARKNYDSCRNRLRRLPCQEVELGCKRLDFGYVALGSSATFSLKIRNVGSSPLEIGSIRFREPADEFWIDSGSTPRMVGPRGCVDVEVRYTPADTGEDGVGLSIETNDLDEPSLMVTVRGFGIEVPPSTQITGFTLLGPNAQGFPEYLHEQTGIIFVSLPGGPFWMGAQGKDPDKPNYDPDACEQEGRVHEVTLSPFLIAKYELTQGQWEKAMGFSPLVFEGFSVGEDPECLDQSLLPVKQVPWEQVQRFEKETGLSLPTEAQWEYACRAGTFGAFSGTGVLADMGWKTPTDGRTTYVVGQKRPNQFGLHDMHGSVWEWCEDVYDKLFYWHPKAVGTDPVAMSDSEYHVIRGGCPIYHKGYCCRSAIRAGRGGNPSLTGFRPVRSLQ